MTKNHGLTSGITIFLKSERASGQLQNFFAAHPVSPNRLPARQSQRCNRADSHSQYQYEHFVAPTCHTAMNEYSQPGAGKISLHGGGLGAPSPEQVEQRAREIAMIGERDPDNFTDEDWDQARRELHGAAVPSAPEETRQNAQLEDEWQVVASDSGHRVSRSESEEETLGEQLVTGGVEEATHDQMLEARREELEEEGRDS